MSTGARRGVQWKIIAARCAGITKQQVLNVIELTILACGPVSGEVMCERSEDYFNRWDPSDDDESAVAWPQGWTIDDPGAHESRMDFIHTELTDDDWARLCALYRRR